MQHLFFFGEGLIEIEHRQNRYGGHCLLKSHEGYSNFLIPSELPFLEEVGKGSSDDAIIANKFLVISCQA
jgi:hypothetical protein